MIRIILCSKECRNSWFMLVTEENHNGVLVLILSGGRLDQHNSVALETVLQRTEDQGARPIIFNLEKVYAIDAYGIGMLFLTYHRLKAKGIQLSLVNIKPEVKQLLDFVDLPHLIPMFESPEEAVSGLESPPQNLSFSDCKEKKPLSPSSSEPMPIWIHWPTREVSA